MQVIATAGHVDHGKSTLLRALTGMDPDRWSEEKRRGLTIDLGFAWLKLPSGERIAFVDVPGHERFVPNMLAGVGPVPAVLFMVAADEGWMPQSAEHLAVVDALGIRSGLLVITRSDLADPGPALAQASAELSRSSLGVPPAIAVSAVTGDGLADLVGAIDQLAQGLPVPDHGGPVRLWVDRAFTMTGSGTVVTGTLPGGTVHRGDELVVTPSMRPVRVRDIQTLGESAPAATGVARVALNLRGVSKDSLARGMAIVQAGRWTATDVIDVRLCGAPEDLDHPVSSADLAMRLPRTVTLHIGSARTVARVRPLSGAIARLSLRDPLPLHVGDRVLLRDPGAAGLAIHGATVVDPAPPPLGRRGAAAAAAKELSAWPDIPTAGDLLRRHKLMRAAQLTAGGLTDQPALVAGEWLADPAHWSRLRAELPAVVADFCARDPLAPGMPTEAARAALKLPTRDLVTALVTGDIVQDGGYLRIVAKQASQPAPAAPVPASAAGRLPPTMARAVQAVLDDLARDPFAAPDAERLRALGLDAKALATAARVGLVLRVADLVVLAPDAGREAARRLAELDQPFTTSQARQALSTSRRVAIPLLEYLDRARVTERLPGDLRRVRAP